MHRLIAWLACVGALACVSVPAVAPEPAPGSSTPDASTPAAVIVEAPPVATQTCAARTLQGSAALVPDGTDWLVSLSPRQIMSSGPWQQLRPAIVQNPDWTAVEAVFSRCGVAIEQLEQLLVGARVEDEAFVAILIGAGIAQPQRAQCVIEEIQRSTGEEVIADLDHHDGDTIIQFTDGRAYLFENDMLVLTTSEWEDEVGRLARCEGVGAVQRALLDPLRGVDLGAPVWLVGRPWPGLGTSLGTIISELEQLRTVAANMYLDGGISISATLGLGDAQTAASLASTLQAFIQLAASSMPPGLGAVPGRLGADAIESTVELRAAMTTDELRALLSL